MKYASFWQRLVASLFEGQLGWFVLVAAFSFGAGSILTLSDLVGRLLVVLVVFVWWSVLAIFYAAYFTSAFGGPIGKLLSGIEVTDDDGQNLSFFKSLFRSTVGYAVSNLVFGLGFLWIFRDEKSRGWHDLVSGSEVVNRTGNGVRTLGLALVTVTLFLLNCFSLAGSVQSLAKNGLLVAEIGHFFEDLQRDLPSDTEPPAESETQEI